jgi:CBS-domain-containing membrane protein
MHPVQALSRRETGYSGPDDGVIGAIGIVGFRHGETMESLPEYGPVDPDDPPQVQDGPVLASETVRRVTCDCAVVPIMETAEGEPISADASLRDALAAMAARRVERLLVVDAAGAPLGAITLADLIR